MDLILEPEAFWERGDSVAVLSYDRMVEKPKWLAAAWGAMNEAPKDDPRHNVFLSFEDEILRDVRTRNIGFVCKETIVAQPKEIFQHGTCADYMFYTWKYSNMIAKMLSLFKTTGIGAYGFSILNTAEV